MASWQEFRTADPGLAARGEQLLRAGGSGPDPDWFGIALLATVRPDGGPRLAPVCPIVVQGRMFLAAVGPKVGDLERDGRYMLHTLLGKDDAEFSIRGRATRNDSPELRAAAAKATAGTAMLRDASREVIFELDVVRADSAVWENVGKPGTRAIRRRWRADR